MLSLNFWETEQSSAVTNATNAMQGLDATTKTTSRSGRISSGLQ
jgi:hypothetical protein